MPAALERTDRSADAVDAHLAAVIRGNRSLDTVLHRGVLASVSVRGSDPHHLADGEIDEERSVRVTLGRREQLGAVPTG